MDLPGEAFDLREESFPFATSTRQLEAGLHPGYTLTWVVTGVVTADDDVDILQHDVADLVQLFEEHLTSPILCLDSSIAQDSDQL